MGVASMCIMMCKICFILSYNTLTAVSLSGTLFKRSAATHMWAEYNMQETKSILDCCRLCRQEKSCLSVTYNREVHHCGFVPLPSLALGLTDWTDEEGEWETYTTDDWLLVFRGIAGNGIDFDDAVGSPDDIDEIDVNCLRLDNSLCFTHFRLYVVDFWEDLGVSRVKLSLFKDGEEKHYIVFDGTGSDKDSWFDQNRILDSSWPLIQDETFQYFSTEGDVSRIFFINFPYMGCENDSGYLMILTGPPPPEACPWDHQEAYPAILFADGLSATKCDEISDSGRADFITISIKASGPLPEI